MMKPVGTCRTGGVGIGALLLVAFIVLKLCGVISWSWLWVLAPLWIPVLIAFVVALFILFIREAT